MDQQRHHETAAPQQHRNPVGALVFREGYRLTLVLEPDGRLRAIVHSSGIEGPDFADFWDRSTPMSSDVDARALAWYERLRVVREEMIPVQYTSPPPGAAPGQPDTVHGVLTPIPAADGSLDAILLQAEDKTSALRTETQLRESEERFRMMAESLPQMIWVAEASGDVAYFSSQWSEFTGRTQEQLLGRGFRDLVHPEDLGLIHANRDDDGKFQVVAFRMRRTDGEYRWMEAEYRALRGDDGHIMRWVGATTDVTDRRTNADAVREQQEQLRAALSASGMGRFAVYFRDGRITGDSRLFSILGVDIPELMQRDGLDGLLEMIHLDDVDFVRTALTTAMAGGPDYDVEYRMWRPTDDPPGTPPELRWVAARGRVEFDDDGPVRMVGVVEDITQRKTEEEARLRWQKREAIGALAGGIAHDFNNVISAILSNAFLAEAEVRSGASPATSITEIARGAERAADVVKRLLAFSREDEPVRAPFDLAAVVEEACSLLSSTLPRDVTLRCTSAANLPPVIGSSSELHQVVMNLVANAGYAADDRGGTIDVVVDAVPSTTGSPATPVRGPALRVTVTDSGPGIPPSLIEKIFDPFFTTKPAGKGTGLGLAAAQTIVRGHGGVLIAENVDGRGARFTVLVPAFQPAGDAPPELAQGSSVAVHEPALEPAGKNGRVIFVDDEAALVRLAERALPAHGYAIRAFTDPAAAFDAIAAAPQDVDVLITDLSMPGLSGLELIQGVRAIRPDLPVVLSSGFLTSANRDEAHRHGVDVIVPKPCAIDDLVAALRGLVDRVSPADAPR